MSLWPFGSSESSSGCDGHHFGEPSSTGNYRLEAEQHITTSGSQRWYRSVEKEVRLSCQHSGCHYSEVKWTTVEEIHEDTYDDLVEQLENVPPRRVVERREETHE